MCAQRGGGYRDAPGREGAAQVDEKPAWAEDTEDQRAGRGGAELGGRGYGEEGVARGVAWRGEVGGGLADYRGTARAVA